jgi:hypothetical protein
MQEQMYQHITSELATNIANQAIEIAELKAVSANYKGALEQVQEELAAYKSLIDGNDKLRKMFEEEKGKGGAA